MKRYLRAVGILLASAFLYQVARVSTSVAEPVSHPTPCPSKRIDSIVQFGTYDQLTRAELDGVTPVHEVAASGDFGLGTFNGLDGEMIVLDGVVYHGPASGHLEVARPDTLVPFAAVTHFRPEQAFRPSAAFADYPTLQGFLTTSMPDQTQMLAIKIHGTLNTLKIRAPQKQVKPYPVIADALKTQVVFDFTNISGTLVGFRLPTYLGTANATGYHFHFVSDDRRVGGHVLDVGTGSVVVEAETVERLDLTAVPGGD